MIVLFLLFSLPIWAAPLPYSIGSIGLQLELALTEQEREWGLSERVSVPEDQGMLFRFETARFVTLWMYRVQFDLDIAFLDEAGSIREIRTLKAHPHIQEAAFFAGQALTSSFKASYALEMNAGWFARHGIGVGARLISP